MVYSCGQEIEKKAWYVSKIRSLSPTGRWKNKSGIATGAALTCTTAGVKTEREAAEAFVSSVLWELFSASKLHSQEMVCI